MAEIYGIQSDSFGIRQSVFSNHNPAPPSSQLLKHREPLAPYAVNYGNSPAKQPRISSAPIGRAISSPARQIVGLTNPHRPWSGGTAKPAETSVTRAAPFGSRLKDSLYFQASTAANGRNPAQIPGYSSLGDPHLQDYFAKKFANPHPPVGGRRRPGSAKSVSSSSRLRSPRSQDVSYKVAVTTGDKKGASTDARVFIKINGSKGKLAKQQLCKKSTSAKNKGKKIRFKMNKGATHVFKLSGKDIGDVKSIIIEHDGLTKAQGWFLEQIEIVKKNPKTGKEKSWIFLCKQWLSLHEGDCQLSRELFAKKYSKTEYEIVVVTGNEKGAGTDANVSITIFGKSGNTPKLALKTNKRSAFEKNQSDVFKLKTQCVGPMDKIRIQHDNTGFGPGWFLDRVVVTDLNNPKWKYYFPCGMWLAKDEGDGQICRDLAGSRDPLAVRKMNKYKVTVYTADKRGAGTDANVAITLFGESGDSGERKLDNSKNNFERGRTDEFLVECPCLGPLKRVRIGHDDSGFGAGWYLDKVIVDDLDQGAVYEFPCDRWFDKKEDDGAIWRDLLCNIGVMDAPPGIPYVIHVMTSDISQAGTSARIFVVLYGGKDGEENSSKIWLEGGDFERGRTDIFNVEVANKLSPLSRIDIGHDNSGAGPGWHLDKVMVNCPSAGFEQWFHCDKWFATDEGDGLIERTLHENIGKRKKRKKMNTWHVVVVTSDIRGAGTDASVNLVLYGKTKDGEYKKSDEIKLENKGDNFEAGEIDKFKVEIDEIGKPYKVRVGHDNEGTFAAWHLDRIEMENMATKKRYTFKCGRWLAEGEEDGSIIREMPAEADDIKKPQPLCNYDVQVHTGDKRGAGTDADVFLNIFGEQGDTGERPLIKSKTNKNKFERGNVDEFTVEAVDLKKLKRIRIGHNGTGGGNGWFLDKVVVQEEGNPESNVVFECNRWLDVKEDDGLIVREITAGGSQLLSTTSYHTSVKTGDVRGAGTDANVYIKIFGEKGDTGTLWLKSADNSKNKFERARTDLFKLEAHDIGKIEKIRIGHDGSGPGSGWFLDEVQVDVPSQGQQYVFACHRWLDTNEEDGQIELELEPTHFQQGKLKIPYEVTVWTGNEKGAGTDANVFLQMYGENGKTEEVQLRNRTDNFETGQIDKFKIEAEDIGPILKVRLGHDGAGMFSGWFLDKMLIQRHLNKGSKRRKRKGLKRKSSIKEIGRSAVPSDEESEDERGRRSRGSRRESVSQSRSRSRRKFSDSDYDSGEEEKSRKKGGKRPKSGSFRRGKRSDSEEDSDKQSKRSRRSSRYSDGDDSENEKGKKRGKGSLGKKGSLRRKSVYGSDSEDEKKNKKRANLRRKNVLESDEESDDDRKNKKKGGLRKKSIYASDDDDSEDEKKSKRKGSLRRKSIYGSDSEDEKKNKKKGSFRRKSVYGSDSEDEKKNKRKGSLRRKSIYGSDSEDEKKNKKKGSFRRKSVYGSDSEDEKKNKRKGSLRRKSNYASDESEDDKKKKRKANLRRKSVYASDDDSDDNKKNKRKGKKGRNVSDESEDDKKKGKKGKYLRDFKKEKRDKEKEDADDDDEETEDYWFVCNRWFAKGEDDGKIIRELVPTDEHGKALDTGLSEIEYQVMVYTGDVWGAGTDANVLINISGEFGDTGERELNKSNNINKFERNQEDEFEIKAVELGRLKKVKIRHDNKGGGAAWFLGHVEITDPKNRDTYFFPCQRWLSVNEDDGQIARELVPVDKNLRKKLSRKDSMAVRNEIALETKAAMTTYHVYVYTADKWGAGTDANVYIILHGENDDTGQMFLKSSKTHKDKFERNQMDEFVIEAVDIGELQKIKIGHDNAGGGGAWCLDRVEVDCPSLGRKWLFPCGRWLAKDEDDGKLERELYPQDMATEEYIPCVPYEITTYTSDVKGAGTDADVYVVLYGKDMCTQQKSLCPVKKERKKLFEKSSVDKFVLEMEDVGDTIEKLRIGHDGTGWGAGWHMDKVEVRRLKDTGKKHGMGSETFTFSCKRWFARGEDDGAIERELVPDKIVQESTKKDGSIKRKEINQKDKLEMKKYIVEVHTGDVRGGGTDANVFINMFGSHGDTGERKLHKSETHSNKFERAQLDKFTVEAADLGKVFKIKIRHDNAMFSPAWFLDKVEVTDTAEKEKYLFYCERWLGKNKDDGRIDRTLYVKGYEGDMASSTGTLRSSRQYGGSLTSLDSMRSGTDPFSKSPRMARRHLEEIPEGPTIPYTVKVVTGEEKNQGTESNAWIKILGPKKKHSGKLYLELAQKKGFLPGSMETFSLEAVDVDDVKHIEIGHDGVTPGTGWWVKEVEVIMPTKGKHYFFTCKQWLARDKGDGKTSRIFSLQDGDSSLVSFKPMVQYEMSIFTGDEKDAGTDSQVSVKLFGEKGTTSDILLDKLSERFERARNDLIKLEIEDIAPLKKLRIGIDGKGSRPEWYLDKVQMRNMDTGDLTTFKAGKWLSKSKGDGKLQHDLVALVKGKEQLKTTTYKVHVKTSDVRGAGTDANVHCVLFGVNGDSGDLHLKDSETNKSPFQNNQSDTFTFPHLLSLGQLTKLRIWHDNKGFGSAWHCAHVEVEEGSKQKYMFPCNRWLSKTEDDKQICRELTCANMPSPGTKEKMTYEIAVRTEDSKDAGMMHNAWLILDGEQKSSKEFVMENGPKNKVLRRGQTDVFTMVSRNLGTLEKCILGAVERDDKSLDDAQGRAAMWKCHDIVVTNKTTGDKYTFTCKKWIQIAPKISRKYSEVLEVKKVEESTLSTLRNLGTVKYEIVVVTGDLKHAGTDANVSITVYGSLGESGKRPLQQRMRDLFERNQTDKFQIEAVDLGDLTKVLIEHDNKGWGAGWFLERIEITNMASDHKWIFPCAKWFDKKKGDGLIARELLPRD